MALITPNFLIITSKNQIVRYQPPPRAEEKRLHRPVRATRRALLDRRRWQVSVSEFGDEPLSPRSGQVETYSKATLQAMPSRESTQPHATQPKATQPHTTQTLAKPVRKKKCQTPETRKGGNRNAKCEFCNKRSDVCICAHRPVRSKKSRHNKCPHGKEIRSACKECKRAPRWQPTHRPVRSKKSRHKKCPHGKEIRSACKECKRAPRGILSRAS
jgi:hypothetical protein